MTTDNKQAFALAKQAAEEVKADGKGNAALRYLLGGGIGGGAGFLGGKYLLDLESPGALAATTGAGALTGLGTVALLDDAKQVAPQANKEERQQIVDDAGARARLQHVTSLPSYIDPGLAGIAAGGGVLGANALASKLEFDIPKRNAFAGYQAPEKLGETLLRYGKVGSNALTKGVGRNFLLSAPASMIAAAAAAIMTLRSGVNAAGEKASTEALTDIVNQHTADKKATQQK